jgi:sarcosine reductase
MKLDLAYYPISDVQFGKKTKISDRVLYIDHDELRLYLLSDKNFSDIKIEIAHPGEMTRIINILDIVDPRKKRSEDSEVFPGFIGKLGTVEAGRINILKNDECKSDRIGRGYSSSVRESRDVVS